MFELTKEFRFEAAHKLPNHDGKCRRLHGHSWKGRVIVRGGALHSSGPKVGMLQDYGSIKETLEPIIESKLDHWYLNETLPMINPTSENIAAWLYYELAPVLKGLYAVEIEETCTTKCRYQRVNAEPLETFKDLYRGEF